MVYKGIIRGRTIELEESLPYGEGESVQVIVEPVMQQSQPGSPLHIIQMLQQPPHLDPQDVDELERMINESKLPVHEGDIFNGEEVRNAPSA